MRAPPGDAKGVRRRQSFLPPRSLIQTLCWPAAPSLSNSSHRKPPPCELSASGGYKKGDLITIKLDTGNNLFPNGDEGQRFTVSTAD